MSHNSTQHVNQTGANCMRAFLHDHAGQVLYKRGQCLVLRPLTLVMPCCQGGSDCLELLFVSHCFVCEHPGGAKAQGTPLQEYLS